MDKNRNRIEEEKMIKLSEILLLDKLVYSETIPKKHQDLIDKLPDTMFAKFDLKQLKSMYTSKQIQFK